MTQPNCRRSLHLGLLSAALSGGALALTTAVALVVSPTLTGTVEAALQDSPKTVVDEAWQIVNREYVDPQFNRVDWQQVRRDLISRRYSSRADAYTALRDALKRLDDPYTRFLDPQQFQALTTQTSGELTGVGIRLELNEKTKALTVVEPIENSPALRAGVQAGDRILKIDGRTTEGMSLEAASNLIRGRANTQVRLMLERQGRPSFELTLARARIDLPAVRSAVRTEGDRKVGYIRLNEFSAHAAEQMRAAIQSLNAQKVDAFVLDLRGNPGGLLSSGIEVARMWIDDGGIVRTVDRNGKADQARANGTALTNLPLAVLVDAGSASASEIVTGALKDNNRAVVVGTPTFGKALVQSVHSLSDGSGLAVTIAHYYTPAGTDISQRGITPDVAISLTDEQRQELASHPDTIGTNIDPQYKQAIAHLSRTAGASRPTAGL
ncbi:carboxyl-terminal processing protease CtpB [Leptolyngbya sp. FACHB-261]|uniref:carboxyl-terminal processing protease CtpB n=1 Tax=Leptolyngbya sp. FACHB-261 TaxID=2692806 RepID=UPI0016829002|nr:carboxyl-terminal processing protease CtpB [Leptolyngbya sp. FACHB-261]MBD2102247.1 S41 family peptidase [Leptolyngbya sp. FACHB-261]